MKRQYEDTIKIISSVLNNDTIATCSYDCEMIKKIAKAHSVDAIVDFAFCDKSQKQNINKSMTIYRHILVVREYEDIVDKLKQSNIRYIPLKGIRLMNLYPKEYMRQMSDIDILADRDNLCRIEKIFKALGYSCEHKGHHDVYINKDNVTFEIHETILDKARNVKTFDYFLNPWELATSNGCEYILTPENEYIYLLSHMYGHFHQGGCGIRNLIDLWLFENAHKTLDFDFINQVLKKYDMLKFALNIRALYNKWFSNQSGNDVSDELGEYIFTSGTFGLNSRLSMDLSDEEKSIIKNDVALIKRKFFLSKAEIKTRYHIKNDIFIPFAYVVRIFDVINNSFSDCIKWLRVLANSDKKKIKKHKELLKKFSE